MKPIYAMLLGAGLYTIPLSAVLADACAGLAHCDDAGPFSAQVTAVIPRWAHYHKQQFVRLNLRFRNPGSQPLILGFPWGSGPVLTDNYGNSYGFDTRYATVIGLGIVKHGSADASFVIAPGGSRTASIVFSRWPGKTAVGNRYTADFSVVTLQPIPGNNQVRIGSIHAELPRPEQRGGRRRCRRQRRGDGRRRRQRGQVVAQRLCQTQAAAAVGGRRSTKSVGSVPAQKLVT